MTRPGFLSHKSQNIVVKKQNNTWDKSYKTFYHGNLLPFHGHTVILCYKATLPW
jgi:hypothetical protein